MRLIGFEWRLREVMAAAGMFSTTKLVPLLEEYRPPFAGFFLYFPNRRNLAPKLRALVEHVRRWR